MYTFNVLADGTGKAVGCGVPGRSVRFKMETQVMATAVVWDNNQVRQLPLSIGLQVYLPLALKDW